MTTHTTRTTAYDALAVPATALARLRVTDDAGRACVPHTATDGGDPLRCCLRLSAPGERIALVSYAPLRRWAAETGAEPGAYDEQGPVFIHADDCGGPAPSETYPFSRAGALRTLRRYDSAGRIVGGRLLELPETPAEGFDQALAEAFADPAVALVHVRAVEYGCFHFEVRRP
ncbi:hypothetical protein GCM10010222_26870 [Streptomyces tanashiensis]|uniref:DUF1203 domain-containing protein n=1 Tax=Streptomyces tanashiensis TaxID=67367 RepID=A0ABY6R449_9ACTN|nr:DUF1203 domain-containing protein [Streptomyces tanashiensis]UZX24271.1 DUF1203 domain-containing protein [Streptomyces tanashiensis]GGS83957.1 hypothetical protein GCM10010222_26870 [Streptomyces tanashiensis]GGY12151.1 hypothetical protein GCM10010299_15300 [Streptomyces tanashiensis]